MLFYLFVCMNLLLVAYIFFVDYKNEKKMRYEVNPVSAPTLSAPIGSKSRGSKLTTSKSTAPVLPVSPVLTSTDSAPISKHTKRKMTTSFDDGLSYTPMDDDIDIEADDEQNLYKYVVVVTLFVILIAL